MVHSFPLCNGENCSGYGFFVVIGGPANGQKYCDKCLDKHLGTGYKVKDDPKPSVVPIQRKSHK